MSSGPLKLLAGAGAKDSPVYVDDVFSTFLYNGNSSTQVIDNGIDLSGEGGLVWLKNRTQSGGYQHCLFDTERGATKRLYSDATSAESTGYLSSFNNNGFTLASGFYENQSSHPHVSWTFRKQPGFFDIQTYTGSGENGQTINHDLDAVPGMVIIKQTTGGSTKWYVFHRSLASGKHLKLNTTNAESSDSNYEIGKTTCTSTQFSIDTGSEIDGSGQTYIVYLFAHDDQRFGTDSDEAIIKCGSYTGTASAGLNVDLGFEPQWVMIKRADASDDWVMYDVMRGMPVGGDSAELNPNASYAENGYFGSSQPDINPNATGFTLQGTSSPYNNSGSTYIYMAIRRPHKPASEFAATDLFSQSMGLNASAGGKVYATTYPVDFHFAKNNINGTGDWYVRDRLRGGSNYVNFNDPRAESSHSYNNEFDHMDGLYTTTGLDNTSSIGYQFRRAPGFFDVVAYTGDSSSGTKTINHNLGAVPELMIVKNRDASYNWWTAHTFTASNAIRHYPGPNGVSAQTESYGTSLGLNAQPTSTSFVVNTDTLIGRGVNYVAYLFATVNGISKIGSYTGTGSDVTVDCGFSAGARFILIKRTDDTTSGQHWYVLDSVRGITTGNDGALQLNEPNAEDSRAWVKPDNSGFIASDQYRTTISGAEYLFFAIA